MGTAGRTCSPQPQPSYAAVTNSPGITGAPSSQGSRYAGTVPLQLCSHSVLSPASFQEQGGRSRAVQGCREKPARGNTHWSSSFCPHWPAHVSCTERSQLARPDVQGWGVDPHPGRDDGDKSDANHHNSTHGLTQSSPKGRCTLPPPTGVPHCPAQSSCNFSLRDSSHGIPGWCVGRCHLPTVVLVSYTLLQDATSHTGTPTQARHLRSFLRRSHTAQETDLPPFGAPKKEQTSHQLCPDPTRTARTSCPP